MKKFLFKIVAFTIVLWLCGFAYQSIVDKGLQKHYSDDYSEWIEVYNQNVNHDVVILGSSRAWVQVNPKIVEEQAGLSCFNLGIDGGRLQMQKTMWKSLLAQGNRPKLIIQVVDYFALNTRSNLYWKERFMPYLNYNEVYEPLTVIDSSLWMSKYLPPLRYHGYDELNTIGWKNYFNIPLEPNERPVHTKYNGYRGTKHAIEVEPTWLNAKQLETQVEIEKIEFGRKALNEMISAFEIEKIPVILVYLPTYHLLRKSVKNRELVVKMFQEVAESTGAEYWDMSMDSVSTDMTLYADPLHMNAFGADIITKKLCDRINKYIRKKKLTF